MNICFITGSRAEYGLLAPLIKKFKNSNKHEIRIVVTGMHLSKKHGETFKDILKDNLKINHYVKIHKDNDNPDDICDSIGSAVKKFSKKFKSINSELIILLGDRYEIFAASTAALIHQIPICHIHGGETTRGAIDESFRHSITKMSHFHFVANKIYSKRVKQLGEDPKRIFNVGGFGVDLIKNTQLLEKKKLERKLNIKFGKKNLIVTFHPVTLEKSTSKWQFKQLTNALKTLKNTKIIFTKANNDTYGNVINDQIDHFVKKNPNNSYCFKSLGQLNYLSVLKYVDGIVGNSSSGLLEAPSFKIATINIGDRQLDRLQASSVINCPPQKLKIITSIKKIYSKKFKKKLSMTVNPYGKGGAVKKTYNILKKLKLKNIVKKKFFDL